ncbi:serine/threonine protein kinase [Corallococcus coralloides]|uniref:non-specific serine/threonine protein kinase n=1 Tax=Corallococcus coralloides TaxID=184914 RepID=A0A410RIZ7_CORCK|nr:serine/threonine-protein kinase [Corallococcus coralloides]QAT81816.1 serine/threonine protein kinase [Corallococcus coralloides]
MTATLLRLPSGAVVDGWRVTGELGNGGFAVVYRVEKNGIQCALKIARHRETSGDFKKTHARTLRELTALLLLDHPNIVGHRGYGYAESGNAYLALDYVEGWTLAEWKERKHPTVREILKVFDKLCTALSYMHGRGVLHRDLKPSNVLIRKSDGEPVIIDFSCATHTLAEELTEGGLPPGTDRFRAPEQFQFLREHRDEHRARYAFKVADELFAVGAMLYELLTDPRPTEFNGRFALNSPVAPPPAARAVNARVPEALSDLVDDILSRDTKRRPVDTEALHREFSELLAAPGSDYDVPVHAPSEQRQVEAAGSVLPAALVPSLHPAPLKRHVSLMPRSRDTRRWLAVAVVALVAAAAFWFRPGASPPQAPPVLATPAPPGTARSSPSTPPAPGMSTAGPAFVSTPGPEIVAAPKEGSPVKTPSLEAPSPGRATRMQKRTPGAVGCASLSLVAALAAGCPGSQLRPEAFTCPAGAERAMREELHWEVRETFLVYVDDRYEMFDKPWLTAGAAVVAVVPKGAKDPRQMQVAPPGTRFYGTAYYSPQPMGINEGPTAVIRYDRVKLPGQDEQPVCFVVAMPAKGFKDGRVQLITNATRGEVVDRWP